jgi:hypothetical protein
MINRAKSLASFKRISSPKVINTEYNFTKKCDKKKQNESKSLTTITKVLYYTEQKEEIKNLFMKRKSTF